MLAYLARYTHRVAISNSRLIARDDKGVTFRWNDYRAKGKGSGRAFGTPDERLLCASCRPLRRPSLLPES
ncbi:hypothetical protein MES5069_710027 [Mesorhizobium escarrei]|uniref:Transposase IS801/IS1294 domain-containing protein n=1 Tax=Mesorhizobium escarrei TaxID=666018 RepID=A0ABN8KF20_9HYPH|nr:hypothetical protein MES5069_710027 [Mesorhizobium escarrei]